MLIQYAKQKTISTTIDTFHNSKYKITINMNL